MSEVNRKRKLSALLMASLISANFVFAGDAYKNNVVDVRVNNENGNAVKVIIYTDRPYTDPVVVNKKANNKYVILMPETNSSLKTSPTVTNGSGTISNVTVNTQSATGGKGYTKITITSEKAINVVPRTQQIVSKTKPASTTQTTKLSTTAPVKTAAKPAAKPQQTDAQKLAQQKAKQKAQKKALAEKQKQEQAKKLAQQKAAQTAKLAEKPAVKPVSKPAPKPETTKQPIEVLEQEIKTGQYASVTQDKNDKILNEEIKDNLKNEPKKTAAKDNLDKSVIENIKTVIKDYQNINLWKLLLLAGAITFPIIVIMIILGMDKKINKQIDKSFKREEELRASYLSDEEPDETPETPETTQSVYSSFGEMLDKVEEPELSFHEEQINHAEFEEFINSENKPPVDTPTEEADLGFNNDFEDEDFEPEVSTEEVLNEEPEITEEVVQPEVLQSETVEEPQLPSVEQTEENYEPDGYLSDFANISDSDFFDELTIQTMAENNSDGLPPQSPADEVFNFMSDDEPEQVEIPQENIVENTIPDTTEAVEEVIEKIETPTADEEPQSETYTQDDDELTMLTEVKINDNSGIYLVNYDNFSSLVGHIDDEYFVIKKFDELVTGRIFLKEAEKLKDTKRYLVRVGKNKMVVEVSDKSMTRLMDL